jgi:predicted RNA-binding protein with TRAM domain
MSYRPNTRGFSGRTTNGSSKPVETGKEYTVDITDNGSAGDGIARIQGFIVFVKDVKAGDRNIKVKINSVGSRFATAELVASQTDST